MQDTYAAIAWHHDSNCMNVIMEYFWSQAEGWGSMWFARIDNFRDLGCLCGVNSGACRMSHVLSDRYWCFLARMALSVVLTAINLGFTY